MEKEINKKNNRKIIGLTILIVTLLISTTGATYAFFAITATNTNTITGSTAAVEADLQVEKILPTTANPGNGVMVPQYSATSNKNALKQAIDGGCVDANSNVACQVYKVQFQNRSTAATRINSTLTLTSDITNLKWYTIKTENNVTSVPASPTYTYPGSFASAYGNAKSTTTLGTAEQLDSTKYRYWYVVIWVEETGNNQYSADGNKTFTGEVEVQAVDSAGSAIQGITSTFTG